ncbi:4-hydroxy-tetrahydrodipicolinate synthase [Ferroacidibacillus organovorans]|nr:4-hydroxy-tetrahydrodipicolinate synthase [Ferroacidibacillus organovorans]
MFGRVLTAMVTPFNERLELDLSRLQTLIDHLIETGTTALVVSGTTGESPVLTHDEKLALFEASVRLARGRVPVIAGTGLNSTQASIELTREVDALGVHGFLFVAPYYNKPSQEGLYRHFEALAAATDKPVILYNIPSRTGVNIDPQTVIRLSTVPNIVGIKESSGDLTQVSRILEGTDDDFIMYSGDDKMTLPILALGGHGVVSVASHVVGARMARLVDAFFEGDLKQAREQHHALLPLFEELFRSPSPAPVKSALAMLGLTVGGVRLPLVDLTPVQRTELRRQLSMVVSLPSFH